MDELKPCPFCNATVVIKANHYGYWSIKCKNESCGVGSILTGGNYSTLTWIICDSSYCRLYTFYVGENGVKADTPYTCENGELIEVKMKGK